VWYLLCILYIYMYKKFNNDYSDGCNGPHYNHKQIEKNFRMMEAFQLAYEGSSQDIIALDNVLYAQPGDPFFTTNINAVIANQLDPNHMNIYIDGVTVTNSTEFIANWTALTTLYKYRKRYFSDYIPISYCEDDNGLRTLSYWAAGSSFAILNISKTFSPAVTTPTNSFILFDRYTVVKVEVSPNVFKIKSLVQQTESVFPLPSSGFVGTLINGIGDPNSFPNVPSNPSIYPIPAPRLPIPVSCHPKCNCDCKDHKHKHDCDSSSSDSD